MSESAELRIVFVDRDGIINVDPIGDYVKRWEDFQFEEGVFETLKQLCGLGFEIIIISNQAGIGDGVYSESALWEIHEKMLKEFEKRGIHVRSSHYCLHGKKEGCSCRKPQIGLFTEAVKGLKYDPRRTFFIGDKASDVEAGKRFGIKTIFVRTGHGRFDEPKLQEHLKPDYIIDTLPQAVEILRS